MLGNYFKLQVGDTAPSGEQCPNCGDELLCIYVATGQVVNQNHNWDICIQNLKFRVIALETRLENLFTYMDLE